MDLRGVVSGVLGDMEAAILSQEASIRVSELPALPGDDRQIRQLFQNLVSNAYKYQEKRPPVHILYSKVKG